MATEFAATFSRATIPPTLKNPCFFFPKKSKTVRISRIKAATNDRKGGGGDYSYLDMWRKAVERERKSMEFQKIAQNTVTGGGGGGGGGGEEEGESEEELERRNSEFEKLLQVSAEERDKVQRMQVIDRAAAAIAAARALLEKEKEKEVSVDDDDDGDDMEDQEGKASANSSPIRPRSSSGIITPGPNFWSWTPPDDDYDDFFPVAKASPHPAQSSPVMEKERSMDDLSIPFETIMIQKNKSSPNLLPPLQSLVEEVKELEDTQEEASHVKEESELGMEFSAQAAEAVHALNETNEISTRGVNADGSRWWKETGIEQRPDGVICKWTLTRSVSADKAVEWENKYWEAADEFGYKELGSEKSGRDAAGNVWHEYWRESMQQVEGLVHLEKTADKWGKNAQGDEWHEKWWEHYGASGKAEKWADKWCSINPNTPLHEGHAHVWHERWGETYDGQGGSTKYTDKWAERFQGDGWDKWGDKWDEHFDLNGHGVKQGETWWLGKHGDRWNRTWGEGHNGSGWVHKYGKSSSGEHWDTHIQQDTWYEKFPHYGFYHCFENSVQLRDVKKPSEWS